MTEDYEERINNIFEEMDELVQDVTNEKNMEVTGKINQQTATIFILARVLRKKILEFKEEG